jgi:hypothetical protein
MVVLSQINWAIIHLNGGVAKVKIVSGVALKNGEVKMKTLLLPQKGQFDEGLVN